MQNNGVSLIDIAKTVIASKRLILSMVFFFSIAGLGISLIWPKTYKADVTFIITDNNSINLTGGSVLSGLANLTSNNGSLTADQIIVLIRSRILQDKVIQEFNLAEVFGTDIQEALRKNLNSQIEVTETREGGLGFNNIVSITISYSDSEPDRSYELLLYYFDELENEVQSLNKKSVETGFFLLEDRLAKNELDLQIAEDSLVSFQIEHGILQVEEQAKTQIQTIALIKAEIVRLEVEYGYLSTILDEKNPRLKELDSEIAEYQKQYDLLVDGGAEQTDQFDIFLAASEMPSLFLEYLRKYRDVIIQEEIYKILYPQYEQQKLTYEEITSGLRVIDPASFPTYKDKPKRLYIVIAFTFFGFFLSLFIVLYREWKSKLKEEDPVQYNKLEELRKLAFRW